MIAHVVTFTWKAGGHPDAEGLAAELRALVAGMPTITSYHAGPNLGLRPHGADFGVIAVATDAAGLDAYLDAPGHLDIVARAMTPYIETRQAVQLQYGD
jgi:hypothetical protein